jgi:BirA family biotin operon repressor/biotin-[acetyl-CoA-carboxylase] ligase
MPPIQSRVQSGDHVYLKWPNDVLIGEKKVCGILIEVENDRLLIGIGCNVLTAPEVSNIGAEAGRASTCLADHNNYCAGKTSGSDNEAVSSTLVDASSESIPKVHTYVFSWVSYLKVHSY